MPCINDRCGFLHATLALSAMPPNVKNGMDLNIRDSLTRDGSWRSLTLKGKPCSVDRKTCRDKMALQREHQNTLRPACIVRDAYTVYSYGYKTCRERTPQPTSAVIIVFWTRFRERIRYLHYISTEKTYFYWVRFFILWHAKTHQMTHPRDMGEKGGAGVSDHAGDRALAPCFYRSA
jgi:hypothetical protein